MKSLRLDEKGLGMWIMSKMVIAIFLFSLILVLSNFLLIYQQKAISDTARGRTKLWAEIANSVASYPSASDSIYLSSAISIRKTSKHYTVGIGKVVPEGPQTEGRKRLVFFLVFRDVGNTTEIEEEGGFAAASSLTLPNSIETLKIFNWKGGTGAGYEEVLSGDILLVRPSRTGEEVRDDSILFYRNKTAFCVGQKPAGEGISIKDAMGELGRVCTQED